VRTTAAAPSLRSPEKPEAQPMSRGEEGIRVQAGRVRESGATIGSARSSVK